MHLLRCAREASASRTMHPGAIEATMVERGNALLLPPSIKQGPAVKLLRNRLQPPSPPASAVAQASSTCFVAPSPIRCLYSRAARWAGVDW